MIDPNYETPNAAIPEGQSTEPVALPIDDQTPDGLGAPTQTED